MKMFDQKDCILLLIDVQERLVASTFNKGIVSNVEKLVEASNILGVPVFVSEQYPKGLGHTVQEVSGKFLPGTRVIEKKAFSLLREPGVLQTLKSFGKSQIILCGIETHICVYQTAVELLNEGFEVVVVEEACGSRKEREHNFGLELINKFGGRVSCLETVLFELLRTASHPNFKEVQGLIK